MPELISIERIRREAREAARRYADINDACPYPWLTDAAHAFRAEFQAARAAIDAARQQQRAPSSQPAAVAAPLP